MNDRPEGADRPESELDRSRMTFGEHLTELRSRLIKALLATVIAVCVASLFADELVRFMLAPFQEVMRAINGNPGLVVTGPTQAFVTYFKVSVIAGLIASAPFWIHQVWAFIAAGLYKTERRWVFRFAPLSFILFIGGVVFGYVVLLPVALKWLLTFPSPDLIQNWITIGEYSSLFTTLTLLLGIAFQLPVVMLGLAKAGIISAEGFRKKRKITILLIFIVAGILTPPDPVTQPLVAVPLCFLYELGIILAWAAEGGKRAPTDWRKWRKRGLVISAFILAAIVFRKRIVDVWGGVESNQRVEESLSTKLPWPSVGPDVLGGPADAAFRINDDPASPMLAVAGAGKVAAMRFVRSTEPPVVVRAESRSWSAITIPAGATNWKIDLPSGLTTRDVFAPVVQALRVGNEETRVVARKILAVAMGAPLSADDATASDAAEAWLESRGAEPFVQPR